MPVSLKTRCPRSGARMMFLQTTLQVMCHSDIPTFIIATFQNVNPMHVHNSILRRVKASPTRRTQNCFAAHATVRYTACHVENCLPQFSLRGSGGGTRRRINAALRFCGHASVDKIFSLRFESRSENSRNQKHPQGVLLIYDAPGVGLEPTTYSLTGSHSTIELPRNISVVNFTNDFGEYIEKETS